jgi:hypothetical protein
MRYTTQKGNPSIKGSLRPQLQKSRDNRNKTINKRYQKKLLRFGNQNGRFFKEYLLPSSGSTISWFYGLETAKKTMPLI